MRTKLDGTLMLLMAVLIVFGALATFPVHASGSFQDQFNYTSCTPSTSLWENIVTANCATACTHSKCFSLSVNGNDLIATNLSCAFLTNSCSYAGSMDEKTPVTFDSFRDQAIAQ